jgi:hypothetical protein
VAIFEPFLDFYQKIEDFLGAVENMQGSFFGMIRGKGLALM